LTLAANRLCLIAGERLSYELESKGKVTHIPGEQGR